MDKIKIEVCAFSVQSAINAEKAGAFRVELCSNYYEGGTTPPAGTIIEARENLSIKLHILIRPRGGDFLYSPLEYKTLLKDIETAKSLGADGIAVGVLTSGGKVDKQKMKEIISAAGEMSITFHRAFDTVIDPFEALDDLCELGISRILTSGMKPTAYEGIESIARLVEKAEGRIIIMPGSGINSGNIKELLQKTKAKEFHLSGSGIVKSSMKYINENIRFNPGLSAGDYYESDIIKIKSVVDILNII